MSHYLRIALSRWSASLALASMLAISVFGLTSSPIFAAACDGTALTYTTVGSASCDVAVNVTVSGGVLSLTNDAAATVAGGPFTLGGSAITGTFSFTSLVSDHRGVTSGWSLTAASGGLANGGTIIPLNITGVTSTCVPTGCPAATVTTLSPIPATAAVFLQAGNGSVIVDGDYTNVTHGGFTIPVGSPSGAYTGTVTVTLVNAF